MTAMQHCPFCGSDEVYSLLNTLRCKRCKGIWKAGDECPPTGSTPGPDTPLMIRRRIEPLESRLEKKRDILLARHGGRFSLDTLSRQQGDFPHALFRKYVRKCVEARLLEERRDRSGRIWYYRPR